jgi:hypothetical protein
MAGTVAIRMAGQYLLRPGDATYPVGLYIASFAVTMPFVRGVCFSNGRNAIRLNIDGNGTAQHVDRNHKPKAAFPDQYTLQTGQRPSMDANPLPFDKVRTRLCASAGASDLLDCFDFGISDGGRFAAETHD